MSRIANQLPKYKRKTPPPVPVAVRTAPRPRRRAVPRCVASRPCSPLAPRRRAPSPVLAPHRPVAVPPARAHPPLPIAVRTARARAATPRPRAPPSPCAIAYGPVAVGKMRTTCFEPYQAYWLELFFDNRKCNKIRLANRLTTRSRFGDAAHGQPVHKSLREKKAIPPKFAISITALFHKKVQNTTTKQKRNCYGT